MLKLFKKSNNIIKSNEIDMNNIPQHIAIIMDGNGRWAKQRKLPRTMGHKAGVETIRKVLKEADKLGVRYLTIYAFSTENWKRPKDEVSALMKLLAEYLNTEVRALHSNNVILKMSGDMTKVPNECSEGLRNALELTKDNTGITLNIAFNYGGRDEILRAAKAFAVDVKDGKVEAEELTEAYFENYLFTKGMPDPDLIIRPSGEQRISNFLLWQCAYSEFWYSNICWPDFTEEHLNQAIYDFQNRDRRYGGVKA